MEKNLRFKKIMIYFLCGVIILQLGLLIGKSNILYIHPKLISPKYQVIKQPLLLSENNSITKLSGVIFPSLIKNTHLLNQWAQFKFVPSLNDGKELFVYQKDIKKQVTQTNEILVTSAEDSGQGTLRRYCWQTCVKMVM